MLIISNNVCLNLGNAMRPNPNLDGSGAIKQSSNQSINQNVLLRNECSSSQRWLTFIIAEVAVKLISFLDLTQAQATLLS